MTDFEHKQSGGLHYFVVPAFERTGLVRHCFSSRLGGVSSGECAELNLGFNREPSRDNVIKNFDIICREIGVDYRQLVLSKQVHGDKILFAASNDAGKGIVRESDIEGVDILMTDCPGLPLCTFYADCVPLFFLDVRRKIIALAHSGWRGTVAKVASKTVEEMIRRGCEARDILAAVGPSIGKCHFEVDYDVARQFIDVFGSSVVTETRGQENPPRYMVDLWLCNRIQFEEMGIPAENVSMANMCTCCDNEMFFSYRGQGGANGSLAAIMELVDE